MKMRMITTSKNDDELAEMINKLLGDRKLQDLFKQKGLAQSRNFNWLSTAQETLNLYQQVDRYLE